MPDRELDDRLASLRTLGAAPLPGAAAARGRGDQRTRRTRAALAGSGAAAVVLALVVGAGAVPGGDRNRVAPPAQPPVVEETAPSGGLLPAVLYAEEIGAVLEGVWTSTGLREPASLPPEGCGPGRESTVVADDVVLSRARSGARAAVEQWAAAFADEATATRELGRTIDALEACEGVPWSLLGGVPGTGPDRVYGQWQDGGDSAVFALQRVGRVVAAISQRGDELDRLPELADAAAAKLAAVGRTAPVETSAPSSDPAWDVGSALLTPAEAGTVEPGDWTAEPIVDGRVLDPCGALGGAAPPEDSSGTSLRVQREAGGTTVDTSVSRWSSPQDAAAALDAHRAAVLGCPLETREGSTSTYELLTDEPDRLVVRAVAGCEQCLPYPTYAVVARSGAGLVMLRVGVGEDGDPGPELAEQYAALAEQLLARVAAPGTDQPSD